jgi:hypothetical protein
MTLIDLHMHTTASDGQLTPKQIIELARKRGLSIIAITDHDTTDGIDDALAAAHDGLSSGVPTILTGIELSAEDESGDVHMLGYLLDRHDAALQAHLRQFRQDRAARGYRIVEKLNAMGIAIAWERVQAFAAAGGKPGAIGRPHIARAMVEAGYAQDIRDAFARYLHNDAPAYVARERLSPEQAVDLIHKAGGVAVLAHPGMLSDHVGMVQRLIPAGLDGVEVVHPGNTENHRLDLRGLASRYGLIETGGSDFHGVSDDGTVSLGMFNPPPEAVQKMYERAARYQKRG